MEKVLAKRYHEGKVQYKIRWSDRSYADCWVGLEEINFTEEDIEESLEEEKSGSDNERTK